MWFLGFARLRLLLTTWKCGSTHLNAPGLLVHMCAPLISGYVEVHTCAYNQFSGTRVLLAILIPMETATVNVSHLASARLRSFC